MDKSMACEVGACDGRLKRGILKPGKVSNSTVRGSSRSLFSAVEVDKDIFRICLLIQLLSFERA